MIVVSAIFLHLLSHKFFDCLVIQAGLLSHILEPADILLNERKGALETRVKVDVF